MKKYGYVRVSDVSQNQDRQMREMRNLGIPDKRIYVDKQSGKDFDRPEYRKIIGRLRSGDTLYVSSIDRLGRNYDEIQKQWRIITKDKGIDVVVLDMPLLDTRLYKDLMGTFIADLTLQILSFVSHTERDHIKKRQAEGIAAAKARGVHMGRPAKRLPDDFFKWVTQWKRGKITISQMGTVTGLKKSTLYRHLREQNIRKT
ncbi:MAG: recombinase family protein [Oscillospiraceae bacterium]|nr:recombinase family protein [Oscillospiraceae bacterium]